MGHRLRTKALAALVTCGGPVAIALAAALGVPLLGGQARAMEEPPHSAALDDAIVAAAKRHGVPERLVRRIIMRESKYNPRAKNRVYWGLMQISYPTAKSMGFKGTPQELLNPVVNLRYAVPYLANAFVIAGKREDAAVRLYAAGYYETARSRGLLDVLRTANSAPLSGYVEEQPILAANAVAQPLQSVGIFGALFGPGSQPEPQPQPVATAAAEVPSASKPGPASAAAPAGTFDGPAVAMVANKSGQAAPPKKWTRDGGITLVGRGEQGLDQVASRGKAAEASPRKSRHGARKVTAFAALDLQPTTAQAYANTPGQDPRFAAAASQAAISQATTAQTAPTGQPIAPPQADAAVQQHQSRSVAVSPTADATPTDDKAAKRHRTRQAHRHKSSDEQTQEARAEKAPAASAPMRTSVNPAASQ